MKPDDIPFNELYRTGAPQEAIGEIRRALEFVELDAVSALYDESLHLAREGHLGRSRDRLRVLLCLNPDDAGAHLLLAKVFASQRSWGPAIAELDAAAACGARLPVSMKDAFIEHRDQEQLRTEVVPSGALSARAEGELLALREEVRRMRSERARANRKVNDLEQRSQLWSIATGVVTGVSALALLLVTLSWPDGAQDISLDPGGEAVASLDSIDRAPAVGEKEGGTAQLRHRLRSNSTDPFLRASSHWLTLSFAPLRR